ncbi:MAG: hypothetical protein ACREEE_01370 [Dongiaceae bacterium]
MHRRILGITGALAVTAALSWTGYQRSSQWVAVNGGACEVWRAGAASEHMTWTGDCVDGKGEGPGMLNFATAEGLTIRYQGTMSAGKFQGAGVRSTSDGARIEGSFDDNAFTGRVIASWRGNRFEGVFQDDVPIGTGHCRDAAANSGPCQLAENWEIVWVN